MGLREKGAELDTAQLVRSQVRIWTWLSSPKLCILSLLCLESVRDQTMASDRSHSTTKLHPMPKVRIFHQETFSSLTELL